MPKTLCWRKFHCWAYATVLGISFMNTRGKSCLDFVYLLKFDLVSRKRRTRLIGDLCSMRCVC